MTEYRLEDLARLSGVSARNIRAYRERGLLDPPRRVGRSAYYGEPHLEQLKAISQLLAKGFSSAHIAEFFTALRRGRDLADILGIGTMGPAAQTFALDIDAGADDARALVELGLAGIVDDTVMMTDPRLGPMVADAADQPRCVHTVVRVARSTAAAVDDLAGLAIAALGQDAARADGAALAGAVVSGRFERAVTRRLNP
ncbi:MerR family transcriptional regulator [Mycobacterium sp. NPDC003449]